MTFEELKMEAELQGYNLVKKRKYVSLQRCPKCNKKPKVRISAATGKKRYGCDCMSAGWCDSDVKARMEWNKTVGGQSR